MSEPHIELERHYDKNGKYLGKTIIYLSDLTPELRALIRDLPESESGWTKAMKEKIGVISP